MLTYGVNTAVTFIKHPHLLFDLLSNLLMGVTQGLVGGVGGGVQQQHRIVGNSGVANESPLDRSLPGIATHL